MATKKSYTGSLAAFAKKAASPGFTSGAIAKPASSPGWAPPPAPKTVAPSPYGALPIDLQVGVDSAVQGAQANYGNAVAAINQGEDRAASDYGFKVDYATDANGNRSVSNLSVDPSNPYSRAAALKRSYDQSKAGNTNSMAARGQLYSGALQNAQNESTRQFGEGDNALRQGYMDFIARQEQARTQARTDSSNSGAAALAAAISAAAGRTPTDPGPTVSGVMAPAPTAPAPAARSASQGSTGAIAKPKATPGWTAPKKKKGK